MRHGLSPQRQAEGCSGGRPTDQECLYFLLLCFRSWSCSRKPVAPPLNFVCISLFLDVWIKNRIQARFECAEIYFILGFHTVLDYDPPSTPSSMQGAGLHVQYRKFKQFPPRFCLLFLEVGGLEEMDVICPACIKETGGSTAHHLQNIHIIYLSTHSKDTYWSHYVASIMLGAAMLTKMALYPSLNRIQRRS